MKITDYIDALPDAYKKTPDSNNYKLLLMEQILVQDFSDDTVAVGDTLNILKANGSTLDLYGKMYNQHRGKMNDEQYRYAILQKATRLLSGCDHESIVKALSAVFDVSPTSFTIKDADENCVVEIENLPFSVLQNIGISAEQAIQMIESMLAVGVRLSNKINFVGTFEFGTVDDEYDEQKGFGNVEQTIGGYFGYLSNSDVVIPT